MDAVGWYRSLPLEKKFVVANGLGSIWEPQPGKHVGAKVSHWWRMGAIGMRFGWVEREWNVGNSGSRLKTCVVETRENELRHAGFFVVAVCQRSKKIELSAATSKSSVTAWMKWACWQVELCWVKVGWVEVCLVEVNWVEVCWVEVCWVQNLIELRFVKLWSADLRVVW